MLSSILRFEWRLGTRQASFYLAAAAFLAMGFGVAGGGYGPPDGRANSPMAAMLAMGLLSLPAIFAATVFSRRSHALRPFPPNPARPR